MKNIKRLLNLTFIFVAVALLFGNNVRAEGNNVVVEYDVVGETTTTGSYQGELGGTATIDNDGVDFFIHNGNIVDVENNTFMVTKSNKIIVVKDDKTVYIDTNGDLLDAQDEPTKPGFEFNGFVVHPENEKVFRATYVLEEGRTGFDVTIGGVTTSYLYNEVVELDNQNPEFKYWADEDGQVVSTNPNYKFTVLTDVVLNAVTEGAKLTLPVVYLQNVTGIRPDHKSFLGHLDKTEGLIEYGLLASDKEEVLTLDTQDVTVIPSAALNPNTNEFLRSIEDTKGFTTFRAYARYANDVVVYSDNNFYELPGIDAASKTVTETFEKSSLTGSYANGSFIGEEGITWTYVHSRDENGDYNASGIQGKAIMLRRTADDSKITSGIIQGGINSFSVKLYKGFTGSGDRQVELFINGESKGTSKAFNDFDLHVFTVNDLNIHGNFTIEIKNITSNQIILDDIAWTSVTSPVEPVSTKLYEVTFDNDGQITKEVVRYGETINEPEEPNKVGFTFEGWLLNDVQYDFGTLVKSNFTLVADFELIPADQIIDIFEKVGEEVVFEGVVTGFTEIYNEKYNKVWVEDETGTVTLYNVQVPTLGVGYKFKVIGTLEVISGLYRIAEGATLELLATDHELNQPLLVEDLSEIDNTLQARRLDINGLIVKSVSENGQELTLTLDGKDILVRTISSSGTINDHIKTAIVGQTVNLKGINLDWFNTTPQLLPIYVLQIELVQMTDEELITLAIDDFISKYGDKTYDMGSEFDWEEEGLFGSLVEWTIGDYVTEGLWNDVLADTPLTIEGYIILGNEALDFDVNITIRFIDDSTPVEETYTFIVPSGATIGSNTTNTDFTDRFNEVPAGLTILGNKVALNTAGQFRLYQTTNSYLKIEHATGTIVSIQIKFGSSVTSAAVGTNLGSGNNPINNPILEWTPEANKTSTEININSKVVYIDNIHSSNKQLYITEIIIKYTNN